MKYEKDDSVTLVVEDMGADGEGIGKIDGFTFFVKDALIGDKVEAKVMKVKKGYAYARLMRIVSPSPNRTEPRCPYHKQCGGCQIQALDYSAQLLYKEKKVRNNLMRIGGFSEKLLDSVMEPIVGMEHPYHYRNKAQFPIGTDKNGEIVTGFYAGRTHTIIPNTDCALGISENQSILETLINYMKRCNVKPYDEATGTGLVRHVLIRKGFTTGEIMVCAVINGEHLPQEDRLVEALRKIEGMASISININTQKTNVIMGGRCRTIWGSDTISDVIHMRDGEGITFAISPLSFYQVNPIQTERLYGIALDYAGLTGTETVWDLYCGIGTISLFMAKRAKQVYGVEIVEQAIHDARRNAVRNGINNASFYVGKAEEVLPHLYEKEGIHADVICIDPPRKGCDSACLETIRKMMPDRIVYVSCDSATLARDLKYLCANGYELRRARAVDLFGHTVHVEVACCLQRKDS
ncbi:MAG: 23S rRNA (uracil(1939)-C(5))-methyltransferase RlmD [Lachnospiraceae bacterium]|nr:23S rRNA (uracil(1939)-C(5))-methyltransferase RlmD [Lachnospiraceae bacterium]